MYCFYLKYPYERDDVFGIPARAERAAKPPASTFLGDLNVVAAVVVTGRECIGSGAPAAAEREWENGVAAAAPVKEWTKYARVPGVLVENTSEKRENGVVAAGKGKDGRIEVTCFCVA